MMNLDEIEFEENGGSLVAEVELANLLAPIVVTVSSCASLAQERQERVAIAEFLAAWPSRRDEAESSGLCVLRRNAGRG
ncbi:hypothetical protein [Rhizobacter sp. Root1221]|uniref:hypothetical protein n=1 Tax=Rhizobacter sp. Root1221 TaxID=1736433 RepID=UPI00071439CA|nr:hypothetical protein [Rhizobacter sp. Root1221]KQV93396.1 hypothetical protein ASC87_27210 [Rhizobacter sp. Root1221]